MRRPDRSPDQPPPPGPAGRETGSLGEALAWLDRHINLEAIEAGRAGRSALPTLDRIAALTSAMGEPEKTFPVVHITGTNGKGSTTRICSTLLHTNGLSVGTYTSPHLERLNERIAWNGKPITDDDLRDCLFAIEKLEEFICRADPSSLSPTWFELMTASAYRYFGDVAVDAAVIEVGLGGRYDATNVADADVAVVTNVQLDHVNILGDTRVKIASEKAGILKPGCIAVIGEQDDEVVSVFANEARQVGVDGFWRRGIEFECTENVVAHGGRVISVRTPGAAYDDLFLPLYGAHQGENASAAIAAAEAFFGAPVDPDVVAEAISHVTAPGRLEIVARRPLVLLDGAHNAAGAAALSASLDEDFSVIERMVVVFGCLNGHDPAELLGALDPDRVAHVVACTPPSLRAVPAAEVAAAAESIGLEVSVADSVADAIDEARTIAAPEDLVLVTGSLYLVGAARLYLSE